MNWAEILEEKNALIAKLEEQLANRHKEPVATDTEKQLATANKLIQWAFDALKPPIQMTADNKLPALRAVRERLGKYLEKK
jgi:CHASE3 domain sensor protein